jgi:hypothetical protein
MSNLFIEEDNKEYIEDQTIRKWCNKQMEGIILRVQLEDELGTENSDKSVVFIGNEVDEEWVCYDNSEEEEEDKEEEEEEGDYVKSEMCMVVTDNEEELKTEGPHKQSGRLNPVFKTFIKMQEWEFEYFYIGMTKYYYHHIPNPEPIDPEQEWNFVDQYDPNPMMHEEMRRYENALVVWRKRQLEIIQLNGGEELCQMEEGILQTCC